MKKSFRKVLIFVFTICILASVSGAAFAAEDAITSIDISAALQQDGSAHITEKWSTRNTYSGTEYYIGIQSVQAVSGLSVMDESGTEYEFIGSWDTDLSFEEKAYKCGIVETDKGYELCWGISSYGNKSFTVSYKVDGLVKSFSEKDGFYYQFVPDGLSSAPDSVNLSIYMDGVSFTKDNAQIWSVGFDGEIWFENGGIVSYTTESMDSNDYVNILCGFNKGIFSAPAADGTFEEMKEEALKKISVAEIMLVIGIIAAAFILICIIIYFATRNIKLSDGSKVRRISLNKVDIEKTIPFHGSIEMTNSAVLLSPSHSMACNPILGVLTRWEMDGIIRYETVDSKRLQYRDEGEPVIFFTDKSPQGSAQNELYYMFKSAALGNTLRVSMWEKWLEKNQTKLTKWQKAFKEEGNNMLVQNRWAQKDEKGKLRLTPLGFDMAKKMVGFYKYLKNFKDKDAEIAVSKNYWGDYLVFASLFNLSEPVTNGLNGAYGDEFDGFMSSYGMNTFMFMHFMNTGGNSFSAPVSSGSGGSSISSGGGGFSGGGGGGGSR